MFQIGLFQFRDQVRREEGLARPPSIGPLHAQNPYRAPDRLEHAASRLPADVAERLEQARAQALGQITIGDRRGRL